ncbi:uncharacterized protein LOC131890717, partial [Tigriopus californicus]|uniref:uncharacterized protein LOC131890717 n=1 Tax=Tigriopus californicus TaxID=6832 RepID=UPI0027DAAD94
MIWFWLVMILANLFEVTSVPFGKFLLMNGKKYVCVHSLGLQSVIVQKVVQDLFSTRGIYVSWTNGFQACSRPSFDVFITYNSLSNITDIKFHLKGLDIQSSMMVVVGSSNDSLETIHDSLFYYYASIFFYLGLLDPSTGMEYYQVITFPLINRHVIQKLKLAPNARIIEHYDLEGVEITSQSVDWYPYTTFDSDGTTYGYLIDMTHHLSGMFNFTLNSIKEPNYDWGLQSEFHKNFSGVLGNVIQGHMDVSLSIWFLNYQRSLLVDYCIIVSDWQQFLLVPQMPTVDTTLFMRPFTNDSWIAIGLISLIIGICAVVSNFIYHLNESSGCKVIYTSGWYFFLLLNAFYGGALTMFFANEPSVPFSSVQEAVDEYPSWTIKVRQGYEESILANAFPQKPEFQVLYDRLKSNPGKYLYTRYEDVLEEAKTSQVVFHTFARPFTALLKQQPQLRTNLKVFAKQKPQPLGVIFPKNSPLVPMFKLGIRKMKERGLIDFLAKKWEGTFRQERYQVSVMVLDGGQVIMVYVLMGLGYILCLVCLLME